MSRPKAVKNRLPTSAQKKHAGGSGRNKLREQMKQFSSTSRELIPLSTEEVRYQIQAQCEQITSQITRLRQSIQHYHDRSLPAYHSWLETRLQPYVVAKEDQKREELHVLRTIQRCRYLIANEGLEAEGCIEVTEAEEAALRQALQARGSVSDFCFSHPDYPLLYRTLFPRRTHNPCLQCGDWHMSGIHPQRSAAYETSQDEGTEEDELSGARDAGLDDENDGDDWEEERKAEAAERARAEAEFAYYRERQRQRAEEEAEREHKKRKQADQPLPTGLKDLYRSLVRRLHPDLNPRQTPGDRELWLQVQRAYANRDVGQLESLYIMKGNPSIAGAPFTSVWSIQLAYRRLKGQLHEIQVETRQLQKEAAWEFEKKFSNDGALQTAFQFFEQEFASVLERTSGTIRAMRNYLSNLIQKRHSPADDSPQDELPQTSTVSPSSDASVESQAEAPVSPAGKQPDSLASEASPGPLQAPSDSEET